MNLEKVIFGAFVILSFTLNFGFFVGEIDWRFDTKFVQTLRLVKAADLYPYSNYFLVGDSTYGDGSGEDDGRLFW